jgi:hypothetical protein
MASATVNAAGRKRAFGISLFNLTLAGDLISPAPGGVTHFEIMGPIAPPGQAHLSKLSIWEIDFKRD